MNPFMELHWYNIPDMPSKDSTEDYFFKNLYSHTGLPPNTPVYIYMYNGVINDLYNINHNLSVQQLLNQTGIHFYLYEPLCYKEKKDKEHNQFFYSEDEYVKNKKYYSDEVESISEYAAKNNLSKIYIHTCDFEVDKYIEHNNNITLLCDDIFLKNQYFKHIEYFEKKINKKFICLNWRYSKHRHLLAAFLANKSCHLSWYFKSNFFDLKDSLWFDIERWKTVEPELYKEILSGSNLIYEHTPFCLDIKQDTATIYNDHGSKNLFPLNESKSPSLINHNKDNLGEYYRESFCEIIAETRFAQPTANFSEKILQSIRYKTPFIVLAPPKTLSYLKTFGFKTFDKFWNEDYDDCLNHEERLIKILNIIFHLENQTIDQLTKMYKEMSDILEFNYKNLRNLYD